MKAIHFLPIIMVVALAACGEKNSNKEPAAASSTSTTVSAPTTSTTAPAAPAANAAPAAAASPADLALGEKVYSATCQACHAAAVLGAPKLGDKALWAPRIAQGKDMLYAHATTGIRMMPPKGGNAALKDEEIKAAVDFMVSKAN